MRLFSSSSASPSERVTVVSTRATCATIAAMRGSCADLLEIVRHALLEVARLADVERLAGRVEHPVDARPVRQRRAAARARRTAPRRLRSAVTLTGGASVDAAARWRIARAEMRGDRVEHRVEHRRRQAPRVGVVAAAVIAVEQRRGRRPARCRAPCANANARRRRPSARSVASCAMRPSARIAPPGGHACADPRRGSRCRCGPRPAAACSPAAGT